MSYIPPYNLQELQSHGYSKKIIAKLMKDKVHRWRIDTRIELIHREPTQAELIRIWKNWQLMNLEQKKQSDEKSNEFFGCSNSEHFKILMGVE